MSDVRLSNASPTVERVDARQPDSARPSVRRCLFGSPDPEEVRRELQTVIQEDLQRFTDTYNYDPVQDMPHSPGNYVWEVDSDAPEFYRRPPHERLNRSSQRERPEPEGQTATQQRARKRPSGSSGSRCSEPRSKSPRSNGDDDDDEPSQAVQVPEEAPIHPEVQ